MRNLLGVGGADIAIRFKRGTNVVAYKPGEMLEATVEIHPEKDITCRDVHMSVGWYTEGKGDRDSREVYTEPMGISHLYANQPEVANFSYRLPPTPSSYRGQLITVAWHFRVTIDIALVPDINESRVFILQP